MARQIRKSVRLSDKEMEVINIKAEVAGVNFSTYIRDAALQHDVTVIPGIRELHLQVAKIGNNLNQLTVLCHQGMITCPNIDETREMLSEINSKLSEISEVVYGGNYKKCD